MAPSGAVLGRWTVGGGPGSVANGPGNRVWIAVTGADKLVWFDAAPLAPQPNNVPIPGPCGPVGLVAGNDGRMYFSLPHYAVPDTDVACDAAASQIGTVADTGIGGVTLSPGGGGTVYDLHVHGGKLYAPDFEGDVVRRLPLAATPVVETEVMTSAGSGPDGVTADGAGNIWITEWISGKVARFPAGENDGSAVEFGPPGGGPANVRRNEFPRITRARVRPGATKVSRCPLISTSNHRHV